MRSQTLGLTLLAALLWSPLAQAECAGTYTADQLLADMQIIGNSLQEGDKVPLLAAGAKVEAGIHCMNEPLPPGVLASVYRLLGVYHARSDSPGEAPLWFRTARELDPTYVWDISEISQGSVTFSMYEQAQKYEGWEPEAIPGKELNVPANSKLLIDGRPLTKAAATTERYHLIQQVASDGGVRASWIVLGNDLPPNLLRDQQVTIADQRVEDENKKKDEQKTKKQRGDPQVLSGGYTSDEVTMVQRKRPAAQIPLLIIGGATMLAAGGVYAASFPAHAQFEAATNEADLYATQRLTNTLILASGGVLVAGAGLGTWGALLSGTPTVGVTYTW